MLLTTTESFQYNLIQEFTSQFEQPPKELYEKRESENLDLLVNDKIVQIPNLKLQRPQTMVYDLLEIYQLSANKELECGICYARSKQNDLVLDHYYYSFIRQFNKKCQYIVILKDMCYQKVFRQIKYTDQLKNNKKLIYSIYERKDEQNNFSKILKLDTTIDQQLIEFEYQAVCLQEQVKLYLPVRFKECKHMSAYELSSLLCHFNEVIGLQQKAVKDKQIDQNQWQEYQKFLINKIYQCRQPGCQVKINYDLKELEQNLVLDYELLQAIKLAHPSTIKLQVKNNIGVIKFDDEFTNQKDQFIKNLWDQMPKQTQNLYPSRITEKYGVSNSFGEFFSSILDNFQRIISNQDESKVVKQILLPFRYQTFQISLFDPIANMIIEYPARCIECKDMSKCLDLRTLISILYNQKRQEPDKKGIQCPICSFNHLPQKHRNSILINNTLYLDNQLLAQMIRDNSYTKFQNNIFKYNGKQLLLEEIKKHQIITFDQTKELSKNNNGVIEYKWLLCFGTKDLLKDPLILITCPNQSIFNFDYIYDEFKRSGFKSNEMKLCRCNYCKKVNQDIQDLYYDEFLANKISQLPKNYEFNKTHHQFFTFKDFKTDILGMIVLGQETITQKIENQEKLLNRYNSISKKDQFKKWNLTISNIKFKANCQKFEI